MVQLSFGRPWKNRWKLSFTTQSSWPVAKPCPHDLLRQTFGYLSTPAGPFRDISWDTIQTFWEEKYLISHRNHQHGACYAVEGHRLELADANPKGKSRILLPTLLKISIVLAQWSQLLYDQWYCPTYMACMNLLTYAQLITRVYDKDVCAPREA